MLSFCSDLIQRVGGHWLMIPAHPDPAGHALVEDKGIRLLAKTAKWNLHLKR